MLATPAPGELHHLLCNPRGWFVDQQGSLQANTVGPLWLQVQCHSSLEFLATLRVMPALLQSLQVSSACGHMSSTPIGPAPALTVEVTFRIGHLCSHKESHHRLC
jgi:hypothetical protein